MNRSGSSRLILICALLFAITGSNALLCSDGYGSVSDTLYFSGSVHKQALPRRHDYHQALTMKLFMSQALYDGQFKRRDNGSCEVFLNCEQALGVIKRIDRLTLGIPKIIYLVGWQYNGHDSKYPAWFSANYRLKRAADSTAEESIRWLMAEALRYNTTVSLHVNMFDAYEDSPLWEEYVSRDIIAKNADGSLRACEWGYPIDYAQEWKTGMTQKRIDSLCTIFPLRRAGTIHIDAFHTWPPRPVPDSSGKYRIDLSEDPVSPYNGFTVSDETEAQRKIFRYWASKGIDVTSEGVDFLRETAFDGYQPMAWWFGGQPDYYLKWPASYYCGGQDNSTWGRLFGTSMHGEDLIKNDPDKLKNFRREFCLRTVIWYYLNRLDRLYLVDNKDSRKVVFSENVSTSLSGDHFSMKKGKRLLADDEDIFVPALWAGDWQIVAYSSKGYSKKAWDLPEEWSGIGSVTIKQVTDTGITTGITRKITGGRLTLSLGPGEMVVVEADRHISGLNAGNILNRWISAPSQIPDNNSVDAPLLGNGNFTVSEGFKDNCLRFWLSKNDFWRLVSQADNLSGPRSAGYLDIRINDRQEGSFSCEQRIADGQTDCTLGFGAAGELSAESWVAATKNLLFVRLSAKGTPVSLKIALSAPQNRQAVFSSGSDKGLRWFFRSFEDSVDIKTGVAVVMKGAGSGTGTVIIEPGKPLMLVLGIGSLFESNDPLATVRELVSSIGPKEAESLRREHESWWASFWKKSSVSISDQVLTAAWYRGLYTMASCSRDPGFPPGLFGWTTTDTPSWNGDYHLNYNFQAPFYSLCSANHPDLSLPHDTPLLDFMDRGRWYAGHVTGTRGILYPVGIGPRSIEVTRNFPVGGYQAPGDIEKGGLFYGQRSNASYGLVNMAQYWRCTYDTAYGRKIYPYALAIAEFWEDYLKYENGRYVIYGDAIHEGSGSDMNPVLSLGLIRNSLDLVIDLSRELHINEGRTGKWAGILSDLSPFPVQYREGKKVFRYTEKGLAWVDGNGLGIQQIYPCNAITADSDHELLEVARNTIDIMQRWHDMNTSNSFFVAAIRVGYNPNLILRELHRYALLMYPNSFQKGNPHGIENSCTVTNALNEMLCMSAGNVIRIFSNFPAETDAEFHDLRAWGAFLVSAEQKAGRISDVRIISEKGRPCTVENPWHGQQVQLSRDGKPGETLGGKRFTFSTKPGEIIVLKAH